MSHLHSKVSRVNVSNSVVVGVDSLSTHRAHILCSKLSVYYTDEFAVYVKLTIYSLLGKDTFALFIYIFVMTAVIKVRFEMGG